MKLLIITGMSGAGKSLVANSLEDMGYYCVDNIPPKIIPSLLDLSKRGSEGLSKLAVVTDIRGGEMFADLPYVINDLKEQKVDFNILFIDASDDAIKSRYRLNRRTHPLCDENSLSIESAIEQERKMLSRLKRMSDYVLDTTSIKAYNLKSKISELIFGNENQGMNIICKSFGFKYGVDTEADLIFDVRCLANPFYVEDLKEMTGLQKPVTDYIFGFDESNEFKKKIIDFLEYSMPLYVKEGKSRLDISFGCTGGKHRSVAFAQCVAEYFAEKGYKIAILHRDIEK